MKKEMDLKLNSESMYNLGNLALSIHGRGGGLGGPDVEEEDDMVGVKYFFVPVLFLLNSTAGYSPPFPQQWIILNNVVLFQRFPWI